MDANGYPEIEDYDQIKTLNGRNVLSDFNVLLSLFESTGFGSGKIFESKDSLDKPIYVLQLHTGGWSGCEDMISKLQEENQIFWIMHWYSIVRGGHYEFHGRVASNNKFEPTRE